MTMRKRSFLPLGNDLYYGAVAMSLAVLFGVSCRTEARPESERALDSAARAERPAAVQPAAGRYSLQDFRRLRWLEGSWRGKLPDGGHFYERYRVLNDSTIVMRGFADSTFASATDSARITLRGGTVADEGGARWVATRLDSSAVDFASERDASNNFTWVRESPDRWTATLRSTDRQGHAQTTVYPMERIGH
jgi:hypothetical protein